MHRFTQLAAMAAPLALIALFGIASCDGATTTPQVCDTGDDTDSTEIDWSEDNTWDGTPGADEIFAGDGADVLNGLAGNDTLFGQLGPDDITGGPGDDDLYGGIGADNLLGDEGNDNLYGEQGPDTLGGGVGDDILYGGPGNDTMRGANDNDDLYGGLGSDDMNGGEGNDTLDGGPDDDVLNGNEGVDLLYGGEGDDVIDGGPGEDALYGGPGDDTFVLDAECNSKDVIWDFGPTTDEIKLPVDIFMRNITTEGNPDGTGTFIISDQPTRDCVLAFVNGSLPAQVLNAISEQ